MTDSTDRRIAFGLFVVVFVTYGFFFGGGGWNQNAQFSLTRAIVERGTFSIDPYAFSTGDVSRFGGRVYANKSPGASFFAVAPYALIHAAERAAGSDPSAPMLAILNLYLCTMLVSGLAGAALVASFFRFSRTVVGASRSRATALALVLAFGTPLFPFATMLFAHVASALFIFLTLTNTLRDSRFSSAAAGGAAGMAAMTNYLAVPLLPLFALIALIRRGPRSAAFYGLAALPGVVLLGWYQKVAFGGWMNTPIETMDQRFVNSEMLLGIVRHPALDALYGITFSPYRGLFFVSPVLIIGLLGFWTWWRRGRDRLLGSVCGVVALWFLAFNASFNGWEAGFSFGPRYLIPAIPFFAIPILRVRFNWRVVWVVLAVVSIANNFTAAAVDPQPSGSIPRPLTQYLYPLLINGEFSPDVPLMPPWSARTIRGHVAVNPHTPDQYKPFMLYPPGSPPSQWASFNLGESLFGAGSPWSLLPVLLWMAGGSLWLLRRALRTDVTAPLMEGESR